jgi:hypothetical protein
MSTRHTLAPVLARATPRLADAVVLPTPPFPEVITITRPLIQFTRLAGV